MMKRLFLCFALFSTPFAAQASPQMAKQWGNEASNLRLIAAALMTEIDKGLSPNFDDTFELDIYRFGRTSANLAQWIDTSDGPKDLGCIFRGMSAEAEAQLLKIETSEASGDTREALRRLVTMFADAEMIADAAQTRSATPGLRTASHTSACSVSLETAMSGFE